MTAYFQAQAADLLELADIQLNGTRGWDIQVNDDRFYEKALCGGSIGVGESYVDGWWDCTELDGMIARLSKADLRSKIKFSPKIVASALKQQLPEFQYSVPYLRSILYRLGIAQNTVEQHYNVGNDFYERVLDQRMVYSCAFYQHANDLEDAQNHKLRMSCEKLNLQASDHVLDIGCGWGAFARYAAENYGVSVHGLTISPDQRELALERCRGLPVDIELLDYRKFSRSSEFDKAVSFGMFEHVGSRFYKTYLKIIHQALKPNGLFLLETVGDDVSGQPCNPWFAKYIFNSPTSHFPSISEISKSSEKLFTVEDWHNFGADYDPTLGAWTENLENNRDWIVANYSNELYRTFRFYFMSCQGAFRARRHQMWQIVFANQPKTGGWRGRREATATAFSTS